VRLAQAVAQHFVASVPRAFSSNSSDPEFLAFLRRDPLQCRRISLRWVAALRRWLCNLQQRDLGVGSALVIQGDADATVDWRYNIGVIQKLFPGSPVEYLHGAGHQLANESAAIRRDYLGHVERWLEQCGITLAAASGLKPR
jgi:lysophospholipase